MTLQEKDEYMKLNLPWIQAKTGKEKEFEAALQKLRGKDADITHEAAEIQVLYLSYKYHSTLTMCIGPLRRKFI